MEVRPSGGQCGQAETVQGLERVTWGVDVWRREGQDEQMEGGLLQSTGYGQWVP